MTKLHKHDWTRYNEKGQLCCEHCNMTYNQWLHAGAETVKAELVREIEDE